MTSESPISRTRGSGSLDSVKNWEYKSCMCGRRARIYTSWTLKNPGRRFYTCSTPKEAEGCNFFELFDEGFSGRSLDVINHLNQRRLYLEAKLKLVEENFAEAVEKKRLLKDEKRKLLEDKFVMYLEKKRLRRQLKIGVFLVLVVVVFISMFKK